jgi:FkbM family methyltransferase
MKDFFSFPKINKGKEISLSYRRERFIIDVIISEEYSFAFDNLVVVDIGANIGAFSLWIYDRAKTIYAIEPVGEVLDCLDETIKDNGLTKIKTYQLAITDSNGQDTMREIEDPHLGGWQIDPQGKYPVTTMTLGSFFAKEGIEYADIVKMDVEGMEERILLADDFPKDKIGTIIGEDHDFGKEGERRELKPVFDKIGFEYFKCPKNHFIGRRR